MSTSFSDTKSSRPPSAEEAAVIQQLRDSHLRSVIKAMSWRLIGTIDTMLISYFWTKNSGRALAIGGSEVLTKVGLYYVHERVWARIPLGTLRRFSPFSKNATPEPVQLRDSKLRSMLKAISWRAVGTIDTILVSYFWTGDTSKALKIGGTDVLTKILLYYLHERAWARVPLGTIRRILDREPDSTPGAKAQSGVK